MPIWRLNISSDIKRCCTLSQLRSDTAPLLQDYKHMVFSKPSEICTDFGASPQDVKHLFACNAHPTDFTHKDLWQNPVKSICEFIYLDRNFE